MLKTISITLLLAILSPIYTVAYAISKALRLTDNDLMEHPLDFFGMAIDDYLDNTFEARHIKKLTKQVTDFYKKSVFIPAPNCINLYDTDCILRIADDIAVFGQDKELMQNLLNLIA